jgi:two-component system response regulator HydG
VLETRQVRRLGQSENVSVDFRLVAATNRDLEQEVAAGRFRSDLYYRLDAMRIEMPSLAQRVEDIPVLVDHFLRLEGARSGAVRAIAPEVLERLQGREWPGNVRELANEVARLCVLSSGDLVDPELVREPAAGLARSDSGNISTLAELERQAIEEAIERAGGDKAEAGRALGISRAKIYQRLKEWREDED